MTGDDSVWGWLQTILYLLAAWACLRRASAQAPGPGRPARGGPQPSRLELGAWRFLAVACLLLGLNKQADVQVWLLQVFKRWAYESGLSKHFVQVATVSTVAVGLLLAGAALLGVVRRGSRGLRCATIGLVLLGPFAVLRLARFGSVLGGEAVIDVALELLPTLFVLAGASLVDQRAQPAARAR